MSKNNWYIDASLKALKSIADELDENQKQGDRAFAVNIMAGSLDMDANTLLALHCFSEMILLGDSSRDPRFDSAINIIADKRPTFFLDQLKSRNYQKQWEGLEKTLVETKKVSFWTKIIALATCGVALASLITSIASC